MALVQTYKPPMFGPSSGLPSPLSLGGCHQGLGKDSRWLTLEVCREYARNKCTRTEDECRFAHPPPNVEVQNGRVMCCFDSIKGRCQRSEPPCKYLHPPQHLKEQLLQNGRNNLLLKNLQWQTMPSAHSGIHPIVPTATTLYPLLQAPGYVLQSTTAAYAPFYPQGTALNSLLPSLMAPLDQSTSNIPPSVSNSGLLPPALTPPEQTPTSVCHSTDIVPVNGAASSCGTATNCPSYWQTVTAAPAPLSTAAYVVDSQTGTAYYSPTGFFQGVSAPTGLLSVVKGPQGAQPPTAAVTTKSGLTMYTPCPPPPSAYQPVALASMQSCYPLPMVTQPMTHTGLPAPIATGPAPRY